MSTKGSFFPDATPTYTEASPPSPAETPVTDVTSPAPGSFFGGTGQPYAEVTTVQGTLQDVEASQAAAAASATAAQTSANDAAASATAAAASDTSSASHEANAASSAATATAQASAAATSESNAATQATNAATSANAAAASATSASTSATNASNSATAAASSATNAATSESNAAASASAASTSATNAATQESNAATQASNAAGSATAAANSATNASNSATAAATSETNANTYASNAASSAAAAAGSASAASTSETNAASSASAASGSASAAAGSASAASASETNAATHASDAASSASSAATSATNASSAADTEIAAKAVRFDAAQSLTAPQQAQARSNLALATVASSGAYADLTGKPALATVATTGSYTDLINKPTLSGDASSITYTRSSTGAQSLTLAEHLETAGYSPEDFWQSIDADDTNSVQKAINAAAADNNVVLLKAKTYNVTDLTITSTLSFLGMSWRKTVINYTGAGNCITINSNFYVRVADIKFNLVNAGARAIKMYGMSGPGLIERCYFYGGSEQVYCTSGTTTTAGVYGLIIRNNVFEGAANKGLYIYALAAGNGLTQAIWVYNNDFWSFPKYAILAGGSSGIWITDNWIERHITATTSAVYLDQSAMVLFSRNYCEDEAPYPFITGASVTHGVISDNYFSLNVGGNNTYTNTLVLSDTSGSFWQFINNTVSQGGTNSDIITATTTRLMVRGNRIAAGTLSGYVFNATYLDYDGSDSVSGSTAIYSALTFAPMQAKAWCRFNSAGTLSDSYGVTSVTKTGTGTYTVNLKASCGNAYPCVQVSGPLSSGCKPEVVENGDATKIYIAMKNLSGGAVADASSVHVAVFA